MHCAHGVIAATAPLLSVLDVGCVNQHARPFSKTDAILPPIIHIDKKYKRCNALFNFPGNG